MRKNFDRLVWGILIAAFCIFCLAAIGIPVAVRSYLFNATDVLPAVLEALTGTALVQLPGSAEPVVVSVAARQDVPRVRDLPIGAAISTDPTSRAILTYHRRAGSAEIILSTVQIYSDTRARLLDSRSPRYAISPRPDHILLALDAGQARLAVAPAEDRPLNIEVRTPHGSVFLKAGSHSIRVTPEETVVVVRFGEATVQAGASAVVLRNGQRSTISKRGQPGLPQPAAQNLIVNGNFADPLAPAWQTDTFQAVPDAGLSQPEIVTAGGRKAVFFSRMGKDGIHAEVGLSQVINRDVLDFESLVVRMDVNLLYQSLAGGGYLSSEFPIMVRLDYKDAYGIDRFWIHGFYYQNVDNHPILPDVWGRPIGEEIPHAVWYPYESENLMRALGDIRPARVHSIRIYASGWNFQSMVAEVGVIAE